MEGADSQTLPRGLPAALDLRPGHAVPISERLGMAPEGDCVVYCLNIHAIDRHPRDDSAARNRCLARLARWRRATRRELAGAHGISARTVDRAVRRLADEEAAAGVRPPRVRRRSVTEDPGVLEKAGLLRQMGASLRAVAGKLGLLRLPPGFFGARSILLTPAFMLLARARNPERPGLQAPGERGALPGISLETRDILNLSMSRSLGPGRLC